MEKKLQIQKVYSLSPMQEGMLFYSELNKESNAYFEQTVFSIKGFIDIKLFEKSFNMLVERHDVLRTIFFYKNVERFSQVVLKERPVNIYYEDISQLDENSKKLYVEDFKIKDREKSFDLSRDVLIRLSILKTDDDMYKLIWSFHHILMDGWCIGIVNKEMLEIYTALKNNTPIKLKKTPEYRTYIQWLEKQDKAEAKKYWSQCLVDYENQAGVPKSWSNSDGDYTKDEISAKIDKVTTKGLANIAKINETTLSNVFQAIWGLVLQRYNNTNDVVFGAVMSGRSSKVKDVEEMVGLFINTLPVRIKCSDKISFSTLLKTIQEDAFNAEEYSYYPLYEIQNATDLKNNLIDHIIAFENYPLQETIKESKGSEAGFELIDVETFEQTNYDFNVAIVPGSETSIVFKFNSSFYKRSFVESIGEHINEIAKQVINNANILVEDIKITTQQEEEKILFEYNNTYTNYPYEKSLQQLFEEQVVKTPDNIAVVYENECLKYRELNEKANQLARVLRKKGVSSNKLVTLLFNRSLEMIISILAVLKAGGAYLPIDPEYPDDRIMGILEDSATELVITNSIIAKELPLEAIENLDNSCEILRLDIISEEIKHNCTSNLEVINKSEDLAYVIYTSGSTGKPKGNLITHYNVSRVVIDTNYININNEDIVLQLSNYAFDGSTFDIYGALLNGAKLIMINKDILLDVVKLSELIKNEGITLFFVTTALFNALVDVNINCFKSIRKVLFGGERVSVRHVSKALEYMGSGRMIHVYGPTESTVYATYYNVDSIEEALGTVPIGTPLANTIVYILDKDLRLQPVGVPGELCISGDGLAKGYLNRMELTNEKFVDNPLNIYQCKYNKVRNSQLIYRTGDLARWLPDGSIEFLDRIDNQVKLRGFRIELGEIEAQLLEHENIKEAVVLCKMDESSMKYLCAYIVADVELSPEQLREHLSKELPDYMIPSYFSQIESMPLTSNGKVNKKILQEYEVMGSAVEYTAPRNEIEEILLKAWQDVLGAKDIGINDSYFSQGGDSIKAIQVASKLQKQNLKMEIKDLFQHPTIGELSSYIKIADKKAQQSPVVGEIPLIPIQNWFFKKNFRDMNHFNHSVMLHNDRGFEEKAIQSVLEKIVEHHDVLRMLYKVNGDVVKQYNRGIEEKILDFKVIDLSNEGALDSKIEEEANRVQASMSLENGCLMKARIFKTNKGDELLIVIHHLVVDGVSWRILLEDIATGYVQAQKKQAIVFQEKTNSYKDWSHKLREYSKSNKIKEETEYWESITKTSVLPIPRDFNVSSNTMKVSNDIKIELSQQETAQLLKEVNEAYNTEINDILLTALGMAFKAWCGHDRLLVNLEGHGRQDVITGIDINRTVGWFTCAYPVFLNMEKYDNLPYLIKATKDDLNRIPHNGIGYGILEHLSSDNIKASIDFTKKPQISFNYLGQFDQDIKTEAFRISEYSSGNQVSPDMERIYTIDINGIVTNNRLVLTINYSKHEYKIETVQKLAELYKKSILSIIEHCTSKGETEITPTDLLYNDLSIEDLDDLSDELGDIL